MIRERKYFIIFILVFTFVYLYLRECIQPIHEGVAGNQPLLLLAGGPDQRSSHDLSTLVRVTVTSGPHVEFMEIGDGDPIRIYLYTLQ